MNADAHLARFEAAAALRGATIFELTLIVSGASELSARAISNARLLCETHMAGRHHLTVVDLNEAPASALSGQVLAAPTLVKTRPLPVQKFVGDLANTQRVLSALGLPVGPDPEPGP